MSASEKDIVSVMVIFLSLCLNAQIAIIIPVSTEIPTHHVHGHEPSPDWIRKVSDHIIINIIQLYKWGFVFQLYVSMIYW